MQKDTIVNTIRTVTLDPTRSNKVVVIKGITNTAVNGTDLGINGYLDIGLIDTMKDLFVNLIGALVFSFIGFFYINSSILNLLLSICGNPYRHAVAEPVRINGLVGQVTVGGF